MTVPDALQQAFIDKMATPGALNMASMKLLTSEHVKELMQCVAGITARCKGRIDIKDLTPWSNTFITRLQERPTLRGSN